MSTVRIHKLLAQRGVASRREAERMVLEGRVTVNGETTFESEPKGREAFALQAAAFIEAVQAKDPSRMRSPYGPSLNSLAAVLGANASAERDGQRLALADVEASEVTWNPRHCAGHGTPTLD